MTWCVSALGWGSGLHLIFKVAVDLKITEAAECVYICFRDRLAFNCGDDNKVAPLLLLSCKRVELGGECQEITTPA